MNVKISEKTRKKWKDMLDVVYRVELNDKLILSKELTQSQLGEVFASHGEKCFLFNEALNMLRAFAEKGKIDSIDYIELQKLRKELEALEFKAQSAWGFDEDKSYHNWWLELPGCNCPRVDNYERMGVNANNQIYNGNCPWHGWFDTSKKEI